MNAPEAGSEPPQAPLSFLGWFFLYSLMDVIGVLAILLERAYVLGGLAIAVSTVMLGLAWRRASRAR